MAINVEPSDVTNVAKEFADTPDETIQPFIDIAMSFVAESAWGEAKGKQAVVLLTAHMLTDLGVLDGGSGEGAGPVTSERVGEISRSYGQLSLQGASVGDQLLSTTKYGKLYIMLRKATVIATPRVL